MSGPTIFVVCLACASGAALQAAAGFGFALVAAPLLVVVLGPNEAVALLAVLAVGVNVLTLAVAGRPVRRS